MKIEDVFLYDIKYGKLKNSVSDNVFYSTEQTYMGEDMDELIARLVDAGYVSYSGKRYAARCNYCGNDTFYVIPYSVEENMPANMETPDNSGKKYVNVCSECGRYSDNIDKWRDFDGIRIENKDNYAVEMLHLLYDEVKDAGLKCEIPSTLATKFRFHIFGMKIIKDFEYMIDVYVNADKKHIIETVEPLKYRYPSKKFIIFNLAEHVTEVPNTSDVEFYDAPNIQNTVMKFKQFINRILASKIFKFGIEEFDDVLSRGIELNNIYGLETFSSGNSTYFLLKFLKHGVENGQNGLYITNRNSPEYILNISDSIHLDIRKYLDSKNIVIMNSNSSLTKIDSGLDQWKIKEEISKFISEISKYITKYNIKRLVIDSVEPLEINSSEESIRYLFNELRNLDCVTVCTKFINNINANPIEDMYFTGIAEIGTVINENQIRNLLILKKFNLVSDARRIVEFDISADGELEIAGK